ncbi:MAG: hypothetical protein KDD62_00115 [Bdellovibrionales bacterium]|nr:hypothetical protein [Bdellovibrionales bacterium]
MTLLEHQVVSNEPLGELHQVAVPAHDYVVGVSRSITNGNSAKMRKSAAVFLSELADIHSLRETELEVMVPNRDMGLESVLKLVTRSLDTETLSIAINEHCPKHIQKHFSCISLGSTNKAKVMVLSLTDENTFHHATLLGNALKSTLPLVLDIRSEALAREISRSNGELYRLYQRVLIEKYPIAAVVAQEQFTKEPGVAAVYLLPGLKMLPKSQEHAADIYGLSSTGYFLKQRGIYGATTVPYLNVGLFLRQRGLEEQAPPTLLFNPDVLSPARDTLCQFTSYDTYRFLGGPVDLGVMGQLYTYEPNERVIKTNHPDLLHRSNRELLNEYVHQLRAINQIPHTLGHVIVTPSGSLANRVQAELALHSMEERELTRNKILCSSLAHSSVKNLEEAIIIPVKRGTFQMNQEALLEQLPRAAAVFVSATQTNTGVVEELDEKVKAYLLEHKIPVIIDGCASAVTASLPDARPICDGDNSPEILQSYQKLLHFSNTKAFSADLGKLAGPVGQLAVTFVDSEFIEFAESLCSLKVGTTDNSIWSYGCEELSATIAQAGLMEVSKANVSGLRYQVFQSKAAAIRIAQRLRDNDYDVLPVNGHSIVINVNRDPQYYLNVSLSDLEMHVAASAIEFDDGSTFEGIRVVLPLRPHTLFDEYSVAERLMAKIPSGTGQCVTREEVFAGDPKVIFYRTQRDVTSITNFYSSPVEFETPILLSQNEESYHNALSTLSHLYHNLGVSVARHLGCCAENIKKRIEGKAASLERIQVMLDQINEHHALPWSPVNTQVSIGGEISIGLHEFSTATGLEVDVHELIPVLSHHLGNAIDCFKQTLVALSANRQDLAQRLFTMGTKSIDEMPHEILTHRFHERRFMQLPALPNLPE